MKNWGVITNRTLIAWNCGDEKLIDLFLVICSWDLNKFLIKMCEWVMTTYKTRIDLSLFLTHLPVADPEIGNLGSVPTRRWRWGFFNYNLLSHIGCMVTNVTIHTWRRQHIRYLTTSSWMGVAPIWMMTSSNLICRNHQVQTDPYTMTIFWNQLLQNRWTPCCSMLLSTPLKYVVQHPKWTHWLSYLTN